MWYDVFGNNCQLFVKFTLSKIAPENPGPTSMASKKSSEPTESTISMILLIGSQLLMLPFITSYLRWLRWRGCDQVNLQIYAAIFSLFTVLLLTMTFTLFSQAYYMLAS